MGQQTQTTGSAVRWAHGYYGDRVDFTCWHYAKQSGWTACGRKVPGAEGLLKLETAPAKQTSCKQCRNRYEVREALKEQQ